MKLVKRDVLVAAVSLDAARGPGRKFEERTDRARRCIARAQLKHLAYQYENRDDTRGLKISSWCVAVCATKRLRERSGRERGDEAIDVGNTGAHRDQREHVEVACYEGLPAAHEEGPASPEDDRRRESKLNVVR